MELTDLEYDDLLNPSPKGMPNGWSYWYEKLSEYVFSGGYPPNDMGAGNHKVI